MFPFVGSEKKINVEETIKLEALAAKWLAAAQQALEDLLERANVSPFNVPHATYFYSCMIAYFLLSRSSINNTHFYPNVCMCVCVRIISRLCCMLLFRLQTLLLSHTALQLIFDVGIG